MQNFPRNKDNYLQEENDFKKNLSNALKKKIDLLARLYGEKKITLAEISLVLGIDTKEIENIFLKKFHYMR